MLCFKNLTFPQPEKIEKFTKKIMTKPQMPADFIKQLDAIFVSADARGLSIKEFAIKIWKYMWGTFNTSYLHPY
jgi:hypothetical protein